MRHVAILFSRLSPSARIPPHAGMLNALLTAIDRAAGLSLSRRWWNPGAEGRRVAGVRRYGRARGLLPHQLVPQRRRGGDRGLEVFSLSDEAKEKLFGFEQSAWKAETASIGEYPRMPQALKDEQARIAGALS